MIKPKQLPAATTLNIKKLPSRQGQKWLLQAYAVFKQSIGTWLGITAFLTLLQIIPLINQIVSVLIPFTLGGLMLGCHDFSKGQALKFDHIFAGLKHDRKQLLLLSLGYGLVTLMVMLATYWVMWLLGYDIAPLLPENYQQMTPMELTHWIEKTDPRVILQLLQAVLVGLAVALTLMIPVLMGLWFAPALVVFKKQNALTAFSISFTACRINMKPMSIYGLAVIGYSLLFFLALSLLSAILPILALPVIIFGYLSLLSITIASLYTSYSDVFSDEDHQQGDLGPSHSSMMA